jgi:peptidoglycan/xylan/chitin deacetylase (PgdA/CDA1 family)
MNDRLCARHEKVEKLKEILHRAYAFLSRLIVRYRLSGMVTFTFDDGVENTYTKALPILTQNGFTATVGVISSKVNADGYLADMQLRGLKNAGWEIASHSASHLNLTQLDTRHVRSELSESKNVLNEILGRGSVSNFIAPYTKWHSKFDALALDLYDSVALGNNRSNLIPPGFQLNRYIIFSNTTVDQLIDIVKENSIKQNRWVILMFHAVGNAGDFGWEPFSEEKLKTFCQWLHQNRIPVITIKNMMDILASDIFIKGLRSLKRLHKIFQARYLSWSRY